MKTVISIFLKSRIIQKNKLPLIVSILIGIWVFGAMIKSRQWEVPQYVIGQDVIWYYSYLPAVFIYHDYTLSFADNYKGPHKFDLYIKKLPNNNSFIKTTMGMSFIYAPFFFVAHAYAHFTDYDTGGYSYPYIISILMTSFVFLMIGMYYLSKILMRYVNQYITSWVLLSIVFGTNLYCYTTHFSGYSHHFNFTLITMFLWFTIKWYEKQSYKYSIILGLLVGLIALIRPTNALVVLFFLLYDIKQFKALPQRILLYLTNFKFLLVLLICSLLVWIPQVVYWKAISGSLFYFSYVGEHFYFNRPHLFQGFFGFRKGWLLYSPVMVLSILGFFFMIKKHGELLIPILMLFCVFSYVIFSWWCWWYGGSFGARAMIDIYGVLAIPMAFLFKEISEYKFVKYTFWVVSFILISIGIHHTNKYLAGSIHYDSMTKEAFFNDYFNTSPGPLYYDKLKTPNYEKVLAGFDE